MKKLLLSVALGLAALTAVGSAAAHGHFRAGVYIGGPVWGGPYYSPYYSPYYAPAPVYVQPAPAPVYIERAPDPTYVEKSSDYWYYCAQSATYYPYVKSCPQGWMKVVPGSSSPPRQ
jgi:hypothetical protein